MLLERAKEPACHIAACVRCDKEAHRCLECLHIPGTSAWLPDRSFLLDESAGTCYQVIDLWTNRVGLTLVGAIVLILVGAIAMQLSIVAMAKSKSLRSKVTKYVEGISRNSEAVPLKTAVDSMAQPWIRRILSEDPKTRELQVERSLDSINHGLMFWVQRQMHDWNLSPTRMLPRRYPMFMSLEDNYLVGVGLPLFYSFQGLVTVSAAVTSLALYLIKDFSGIDDLMQEVFGEYKATKRVHFSPSNDDTFTRYADGMFWGMGGLYIALFLIAAVYSIQARRFSRRFNRRSSCMNDFVVHLERLPRSFTSEADLKEQIEREFHCEGEIFGVSIAYNLSKPEVRSKVFDLVSNLLVRSDVNFYQRGGKLVEAGYSYPADLAREAHLNVDQDKAAFASLAKNELEGSGHAFVVFKRKSTRAAVMLRYAGMWVRHTLTLTSKDVEKVKKALGEPCKGRFLDSQGMGLVGRLSADERTFCAISENMVELADGHRLHPGTRIYDAGQLAADKPVVVESMAGIMNDAKEPTSTLWENMGKGRHERKVRLWTGVAKVLGWWLGIVLFIYLPIFYFITFPFGMALTSPSPLTGQLTGIVLSLAGNILGQQMWAAVGDIGYLSKQKQDRIFVYFSTLTGLFNTALFGSAGLILFIVDGFNRIDMTKLEDNKPRDLVEELNLFNAFYNFCIPGWLFAGVLIGNMMGLIMPVLQPLLISRVAYIWSCSQTVLPKWLIDLLCKILPGGPDPKWLSARDAEKCFSPPQLALAWEYSMYIVMPSGCCFALFVVSDQAWKVFAFLAMWGATMFVLHRFVLLPLNVKNTCGEAPVMAAEHLWGIVLATVMAAVGYWGVRCEAIGYNEYASSFWIVLFMWLLGFSMHAFLIKALQMRDDITVDYNDVPYEEVRRQLRYTWFNANPVHVLKCNFCPEDVPKESMATTPFEFGKEYLQLERNVSGQN